jgi:hypothetical protein
LQRKADRFQETYRIQIGSSGKAAAAPAKSSPKTLALVPGGRALLLFEAAEPCRIKGFGIRFMLGKVTIVPPAGLPV